MRIVKFISAGLLGLFAFGAAAQADVLDDIKKRGTLIVGVKADYKPFGFRDPSGGIIGAGAGSGRRRRQEARRQAGADPGRVRQPHGVPQSGQDRPDDRHHVGQG